MDLATKPESFLDPPKNCPAPRYFKVKISNLHDQGVSGQKGGSGGKKDDNNKKTTK